MKRRPPIYTPYNSAAASYVYNRQILKRPGIVVSAVLCAGVLVFGTPHLLVTYHCSGRCSMQHAYACNYYGIQGWRYVRHYDRRGCAMVRLLPLKFR